jgi:hypothetical protein
MTAALLTSMLDELLHAMSTLTHSAERTESTRTLLLVRATAGVITSLGPIERLTSNAHFGPAWLQMLLQHTVNSCTRLAALADQPWVEDVNQALVALYRGLPKDAVTVVESVVPSLEFLLSQLRPSHSVQALCASLATLREVAFICG